VTRESRSDARTADESTREVRITNIVAYCGTCRVATPP
jgi:hypothetical protein